MGEPGPPFEEQGEVGMDGKQRRPYGSPVGVMVAWVAIIAMAALWIAFSTVAATAEEEAHDGGQGQIVAVDVLQARIVLGFHRLLVDLGQPTPVGMEQQAAPLRDGTPVQRVAYAILLDQLHGPESALGELGRLEEAPKPLADADRHLVEETRLRLECKVDGTQIPAFAPPDAKRLGWFADLLVGTAAPSKWLPAVILAAGLWYLAFGLLGLVGLVLCVTLAILGSLPPRCEPPSRVGGVLVETFAIWMFLLFGGQAVVITLGEYIEAEWLRTAVAPVCFLVSLLALLWPSLRGVPWAETRAAVGLARPKAADAAWGMLGYAMALPCMAVGVAIAFVLMALFGEGSQPSHPAIERIGAAPIGELLWLFVLACIFAPVVEEIMFRGVLYRHLRDLTAPASRRGPGALLSFLSIAVAALVSSALFALIHPQGVLFAPALAGLAVGFCIVREVRGSLFPGMVAHGVTNFVTLLLNLGLQVG